MTPNPNSWVFDKWLESFPEAAGSSFLPVNSFALVGVVSRDVVLGPGESIGDLTPRQLIERAIDWEATGRHSASITNIGKEPA
jgi:hypothetical protein